MQSFFPNRSLPWFMQCCHYLLLHPASAIAGYQLNGTIRPVRAFPDASGRVLTFDMGREEAGERDHIGGAIPTFPLGRFTASFVPLTFSSCGVDFH
jgi:hypothetical protein